MAGLGSAPRGLCFPVPRVQARARSPRGASRSPGSERKRARPLGPGWELVPRHFCRCHEPKPSLSRTRNQSEGGVPTPRRREEGNERVLTANRPHAVKHANAPQLPAADTGRPCVRRESGVCTRRAERSVRRP